MISMTTAAFGALLALGLVGCDTATGAATGRSRMEVGLRGDDPSGSATSSRSGGARYSLSGGGSGSAEVEVRARVWVETEAGEWVEVTDGAETETVEASGSDGGQVIASTEVQAGAYHRVRVEFERVEASLLASVSLGGDLLGGSVRVDSGADGTIVVERKLALDARAGGVAHLEVNLNAREWMDRADAETRAVAEAEFREAVEITAR